MMDQQRQPITKRSRDFLKCDQCRKEHKKCLPRARDWTGQQQKCDRCYRLGNPCGPPMRKQKSISTDRNGVTEGLRPSRRQTPRYDSPATNIIDSYVDQLRPIEAQSSYEEPACLVNVAVMIATYEILSSQLLFLRRESRNQGSDVEKIISIISQVESAFERATRSVQAKVARSRGWEGKLGWKMAYFEEWHHHLSNVKSSSDAQAYVSSRNRLAGRMPPDVREARILSCTSGVFHGIHEGLQIRFERPHLDREDYLGLEEHIKNLFLEIQDLDGDDVVQPLSARLEQLNPQELSPFPASHIAYFNQDRGIAFQLWKQLYDRSSTIDIVGRSFIHVVAASQDHETIAKITKYAPEAEEHSRRDQPGLYQMDLTSGPDSQAIRALLHGTGRLARLASEQDCPSFASKLRNNDFSTGTHMDASQDLEGIQLDSTNIQMLDSMNTGNPMNFMHYPIIDPNPLYGQYVMHGQGITFQSAQLSGNQVQLGPQSTVYMPPDWQITPNHNYNPFGYNG